MDNSDTTQDLNCKNYSEFDKEEVFRVILQNFFKDFFVTFRTNLVLNLHFGR